MKEVYLYGCETCDTVKYSNKDNSKVWCVMCQVCRGCEFHNRIEINEIHVFAVEEKKVEDV